MGMGTNMGITSLHRTRQMSRQTSCFLLHERRRFVILYAKENSLQEQSIVKFVSNRIKQWALPLSKSRWNDSGNRGRSHKESYLICSKWLRLRGKKCVAPGEFGSGCDSGSTPPAILIKRSTTGRNPGLKGSFPGREGPCKAREDLHQA